MITSLILIILSLFILGNNSTHGAPGISLQVINESTYQCAYFNPGDEFSNRQLKEGWKYIKKTAIPEDRIYIRNSFGECEFTDDKNFAKQCCTALGFEYINPEELPFTKGFVEKFNENDFECSISSNNNSKELLINQSTNSCTSNINFSLRKQANNGTKTAFPTEGQCEIKDNNWKVEREIEYEYKLVFETERGTCVGDSFQECCERYDYEFIEEDVGESVKNPWNAVAGYVGVGLAIIITGFVYKRSKKQRFNS